MPQFYFLTSESEYKELPYIVLLYNDDFIDSETEIQQDWK